MVSLNGYNYSNLLFQQSKMAFWSITQSIIRRKIIFPY